MIIKNKEIIERLETRKNKISFDLEYHMIYISNSKNKNDILKKVKDLRYELELVDYFLIKINNQPNNIDMDTIVHYLELHNMGFIRV